MREIIFDWVFGLNGFSKYFRSEKRWERVCWNSRFFSLNTFASGNVPLFSPTEEQIICYSTCLWFGPRGNGGKYPCENSMRSILLLRAIRFLFGFHSPHLNLYSYLSYYLDFQVQITSILEILFHLHVDLSSWLLIATVAMHSRQVCHNLHIFGWFYFYSSLWESL